MFEKIFVFEIVRNASKTNFRSEFEKKFLFEIMFVDAFTTGANTFWHKNYFQLIVPYEISVERFFSCIRLYSLFTYFS